MAPVIPCAAMSASYADDAEYPSAEAGSPKDLRSRLIAALLTAGDQERGEIVLLDHNEDASLIVVANKAQRIYLLSAGENTMSETLLAILEPLVKRSNTPGIETHFVVAGGSDRARTAIQRAIPTLQNAPLGFHHVDGTGHVHKLGRVKLPLLEDLAKSALTTAPLGAAEMQAELMRGHALVKKEQAVANKLQGSYRVTAAITVVCVGLMGLTYTWGGGNLNVVLYQMGANAGAAVKEGEIWRLFASAFLHADLMHLGMNMYAFWAFGTLLESLLGWKRYLVLYALCALAGSIASAFFGSHAMSVGASGAIWGLMAGGVGLALRPRGLLPASMVTQMRSRVWAPLVLNALYSFRPGIDFLAHFGGGVVGFVLVAFVLTKGLKPVEERQNSSDVENAAGGVAMGGAMLAVVVMALSVVLALAKGRPWEYGAPPVFARTQIGDTGFSVELPTVAMRETSAEQLKPMLWLFSYGKLPAQPVAFELIVAGLSAEVLPEQMDAFLDGESKGVEQNPPANFKLKGRAKRIEVGGKPAIDVEYEREDLLLKSLIVVMGDQEVVLRGYSLKERPKAWDDVEQKAAASIARD